MIAERQELLVLLSRTQLEAGMADLQRQSVNGVIEEFTPQAKDALVEFVLDLPETSPGCYRPNRSGLG